MEIPRTLYWNCLMTSPPAERFAYLDAVLDGYNPDLVGITEFREADLTGAFTANMQERGFAIDFEPAIKANHEWEGLLVLSLGKTATERSSPWPDFNRQTKYGERIDNRQAVRCERDGFAVYFGHITHPHEHIELSRRRAREWAAFRQMLAEEKLPYAWFADTNTTLAGTVKKRLGDVALLGNDRRTWGYRPVKDRRIGPVKIPVTRLQLPRVVNLDRCAVRPDLADKVSLQVVPPIMAGRLCPSDHLPIFFSTAR